MNENRKYYIYGAGKNGELLLSIMRMLEMKIEGFIDSDVDKLGMYKGIRCLSVEQASQEAKSDIILISVHKSEGIEKDLIHHNFENIYDLGYILTQLYHFFPVIMCDGDYKGAVPFNRFDSPYPNIFEIHEMERQLFDSDKKIGEIDFNIDRQCELIDSFKTFQI